jgi:hypothetical protein
VCQFCGNKDLLPGLNLFIFPVCLRFFSSPQAVWGLARFWIFGTAQPTIGEHADLWRGSRAVYFATELGLEWGETDG